MNVLLRDDVVLLDGVEVARLDADTGTATYVDSYGVTWTLTGTRQDAGLAAHATMSGAGEVVGTAGSGSGSLTLDVALAGSGEAVAPSLSGSGDLTLDVALAGSGSIAEESASGSGSLTLDVALAGSGVIVAPSLSGTGSLSADVSLAGAGEMPEQTGSGSGAITANVALTGAGQILGGTNEGGGNITAAVSMAGAGQRVEFGGPPGSLGLTYDEAWALNPSTYRWDLDGDGLDDASSGVDMNLTSPYWVSSIIPSAPASQALQRGAGSAFVIPNQNAINTSVTSRMAVGFVFTVPNLTDQIPLFEEGAASNSAAVYTVNGDIYTSAVEGGTRDHVVIPGVVQTDTPYFVLAVQDYTTPLFTLYVGNLITGQWWDSSSTGWSGGTLAGHSGNISLSTSTDADDHLGGNSRWATPDGTTYQRLLYWGDNDVLPTPEEAQAIFGAHLGSSPGGLTADVALAGAGEAVAPSLSGGGDLTADVSLAGSGETATPSLSGGGSITANVALQGAGSVSAENAAGGSLTLTVSMAGSGEIVAPSLSGGGSITASVALAGAGARRSFGGGSIAATAALLGAGLRSALAGGSITATITLAGSGDASGGSKSGSGDIALAVALAGAGEMPAQVGSAGGDLFAAVALDGAGLFRFLASGALSVEITLAGAGKRNLELTMTYWDGTQERPVLLRVWDGKIEHPVQSLSLYKTVR
jgi:hypothetical protein